jgi:CheY-like chemotaxis protein
MISRSRKEKNRRILLVDDNRAIHADYRKIIGSVGESVAQNKFDELEQDLFGGSSTQVDLPSYEVDSAYQGEQALEMVQQAHREIRPYAMAFVDMRMPPGWDGLETISRVWKVCPDLQIVVCTAHSDYSWRELVTKLGLTDSLLFLKKPFDSVEVRQLALAMTEKWNLATALERNLRRLDSSLGSYTATLATPTRSATPAKPDQDLSAVREQLADAQKTIGRVLSSVRKRNFSSS